MKRNTGLRAIFIIFWVVGSVFWVLIGALDGNFVRSLIYIIIGWVIIFSYLSWRDAKDATKIENDN
jgi:hypothetical protein